MVEFNILICEDDDTARELMVKRLSKTMGDVYAAEDGEAGLSLFNNHDIDLVITDISMPKLSGVEMIKAIREKDRTTPIVVISAFGNKNTLIECLENGVSRYLVKPVDSRKLLEIINEQIEVKSLKAKNRRHEKFLEDFKKAFDVGSMVSITDRRGVIKYVNDAYCNSVGYTPKELIGKTHKILRHEKMPWIEFKKMWETILDGRVYTGIIESKTKDGGSFIADTTIVPIRDEQDEIYEFIAIRHSLAKISYSYERDLKTIIENSDDLNVILDDNYNPIIINDAFKHFFGDILSKKLPFLERFVFEEENPFGRFANISYEDFVYQFQIRKLRHQKLQVYTEDKRDYKIFLMRINSIKNNVLKQRSYHMITLVDISELERMRDSQMSTSKLAYIGQLSASITHEINTPLTYIKGNLELMKMDVEDFSKDTVFKNNLLETIETMEGGIKRISSIIETMRQTTGVSANDIVRTNIYETLIYSMRMVYARSKHITPLYINQAPFTLELDKNSELFYTMVSAQRMEQVWIIIINNALDELEKSDIEFKERFIKTEISKTNDRITILFKDNGGGIKKDIIDKIFDSFVSTKKGSSSAGMGLGLNIAKTIVDSNGGSIEVYNENDGAVFKIEFDCLQRES